MCKSFILILLTATIFLSCKDDKTKSIDYSQLVQLQESTLKKHMSAIADDKFEGRMPCRSGGKLTEQYLIDALKQMGVKPANKGKYTQAVPLLTVESTMSNHMSIKTPNDNIQWKQIEDFVIHSERKTDAVQLKDSELVFCGYGIVEEGQNWNDYAGIDMKGKTAVILINDPGFGGDDPNFFTGDILTYSGRWDYKYDQADIAGAAGLLIIHETSSAAYPWFVVQNSWTGPQQGLSGIDRSEDCGIKGWIHLERAVELFKACGLDFTSEIQAARTPGFKPKPMKAQVSVGVTNEFEECKSNNIVGYIPGTKYPDEYIVYTAHWDHLGIGKEVEGDSIYNGALDNASGISTLLAIAESFTKEDSAPERSVVFLFVTAEEQGLLGSELYVENPIFPLAKTVCNINIDGVNPLGLMNDLTITGYGHSEMDEIAKEVATAQGRYTQQEKEPEKGSFFRSDQFNFVKKGVPALYAEGGYDHKTEGKAYAQKFKDDFVNQKYHAPSDEFDAATWNFEGMLQDGQLFYNVGYKLANSEIWPKWYEASEFSRKNP